MAILDYVSDSLVERITDNFKKSKSMSSTEKVLLGFLAGAAVGALAGLLLAPSSGDETREKIREGALKVTEDLKEQAQKAWENFENGRNKAEEMVNQQVNQTTDKVNQM